MPILGGAMNAYYEKGLHQELGSEFAETIRFQWEATLFTNLVIELFDLPVPNNEICILWDSTCGIQPGGSIPIPKALELEINAALYYSFYFRGRRKEGPVFYRSRQYLTAALMKANKPHDETIDIIDTIGDFVCRVKDFRPDKLLVDEKCHDWIQEWLLTDAGQRTNAFLRARGRRTRKR